MHHTASSQAHLPTLPKAHSPGEPPSLLMLTLPRLLRPCPHFPPIFHLGSTAMQSCCLMSSRHSGRENSTGIWISLLIWVDWNGIGYISIYCSNRFICLTDAWVLEQETASKESVQLPHFAVWETGVSRANIPSIIKNLSTRALPRIPGSWPLIPQLHIVREKKSWAICPLQRE